MDGKGNRGVWGYGGKGGLGARFGATIFPVMLAFYTHARDSGEMACQFVCRGLAHLGLPHPNAAVWKPELQQE